MEVIGWLLIGYFGYMGLKMFNNALVDQQYYLALTMYGEARGEGAQGMQAVGNVILNRVKQGGWYGASVKDVVLKPLQFSCWNTGDPNRAVMLNASAEKLATANAIAGQLLAGKLEDITGGATNYHADYVRPSWASSMKQTVKIGRHIFYKEV